MGLLATVIYYAIEIYIWIILVQVAIGWLQIFGVINTDNPQAKNLVRLLHKATDPVYIPLRKYIPAIGGMDLTPLIVILGLSFLRYVLINALF